MPILPVQCGTPMVSTEHGIAFFSCVQPIHCIIHRFAFTINRGTITIKSNFRRLSHVIAVAITPPGSSLAHGNVKIAIVFVTPWFSRSLPRAIPCSPPGARWLRGREGCAVWSKTGRTYPFASIFHFYAFIVDMNFITWFVVSHKTVEIETLVGRIGKKLCDVPVFCYHYPTERPVYQ